MHWPVRGTDVGARSAERSESRYVLSDWRTKIRRERAAAHENTYKITYHISDDHGGTDLFDLYLDFRTQFLSEPGVPGDLRRWPGGSLCRRVDPGIQPPD